MANLLNETIEALGSIGMTFDDVKAIQVDGRRISVKRFSELADREYDNGYGTQLVLPTLVMIMNDGTWFVRAEYDGSEWWNRIVPPKVIDTVDDTVDTLFIDDFGYFDKRRILREFGKDKEDVK